MLAGEAFASLRCRALLQLLDGLACDVVRAQALLEEPERKGE